MEENQPKTGKFGLNYGLILGVISVVFGIMLYTVDLHYQNNTVVTVINVVISIALITWGILQFKKANGGFITLSQALKVGVGIALIATILGLIYLAVLANVLDPDFAVKSTEFRLQGAIEEGSITQAQAQQQIDASKSFFWIAYPAQLIIGVLFGLIVSLIVGLIVKKNKEGI